MIGDRVKARSTLTTPETTKTDRGKEKTKAITASYFRNRFASIRRSQWVCFMLSESLWVKSISPIDTIF